MLWFTLDHPHMNWLFWEWHLLLFSNSFLGLKQFSPNTGEATFKEYLIVSPVTISPISEFLERLSKFHQWHGINNANCASIFNDHSGQLFLRLQHYAYTCILILLCSLCSLSLSEFSSFWVFSVQAPTLVSEFNFLVFNFSSFLAWCQNLVY